MRSPPPASAPTVPLTANPPRPTVRLARPEDAEFILSLVPRLEAFGSLPWYETGRIASSVTEKLRQAISSPEADSATLVAEGGDGGIMGFVRVKTQKDYFTGEEHGYVPELAIAEGYEGRGIGRALLSAAETWAKERGHRILTLDVFAPNERARAFYGRAGFGEDSVKMVKEL